jgi:hypothetical protein
VSRPASRRWQRGRATHPLQPFDKLRVTLIQSSIAQVTLIMMTV